MKLTVVDYGLSNLLSVQRALEHLGAQVEITGSRSKILAARALVLPGVGAFKDGMQGLAALCLVDALQEKCAAGTPLLGICLGMQMLFDESEEFGLHPGLGLLRGRVQRIPEQDAAGAPQRVPHVGWSGLLAPSGAGFASAVLQGVQSGEEVYFVHSYEAKPAYPADVLAQTEYGGRRVCAAAGRGNVVGFQFHPEKSGAVGLGILQRYLQLCAQMQ